MIHEEAALMPKPPQIDLIYDDGEPLETNWHRIQINLLVDVVRQAMAQRQRDDFFAGGNMFVYFSLEQAEFIATHPPDAYRHFRGPDFFFVGGVSGTSRRDAWVIWEEGGHYPDVIIELLSPSTARIDKTTKKNLYERIFRTPEYFWYDPVRDELQGWRLLAGRYEPIEPNEEGRIWSSELGLWLGRWKGEQTGVDALWLRFYDAEGAMMLTAAEAERQSAEGERRRAEVERQRAEAERQRADAERQRAEAAEAEVERLRALLSKK